MKKKLIFMLLMFAIIACSEHSPVENNHEKHNEYTGFKSEKISKTASFVVNSNIDKTFPLFGAFEERKWAEGWEPVLIYPDQEIIEEGTTFKINAHGHGDENELLWIVSKYEPQDYLIQYLVSTSNRFWTITVKCESIDNNLKTNTTVTYSFTGLNSIGNELNKTSLEKMYQDELQDWAEAINSYFKNQ